MAPAQQSGAVVGHKVVKVVGGEVIQVRLGPHRTLDFILHVTIENCREGAGESQGLTSDAITLMNRRWCSLTPPCVLGAALRFPGFLTFSY